jgi:hypothetical protein
MPGPVPGMHVFILSMQIKTWMAGTTPAITANKPQARLVVITF